MNYPDYDTYNVLYARYLKRDPKELFEGVDVKDKMVLDLCCGEGNTGRAAVELGANEEIYFLDECIEMFHFETDKEVFYLNTVDQFLWPETEEEEPRTLSSRVIKNHLKFDIIVCRQAVNYWFNNVDIKDLAARINDGGYFLFNTFNTKPNKIPEVRNYYLDGKEFVEISYCVDDKVHHFQSREGLEPHMTSFDWIAPEEFLTKLSPFFSCVERKVGRTSLWTCKKS